MVEVQVKLVEAEVKVIDLKEGDTLVVKLRGDELGDVDNMNSLQDGLKARFPHNQIIVFFLPGNSDLDMEVIKSQLTQQENKENSCNTASYCANCNCGKKAKALNNNAPPEDEL